MPTTAREESGNLIIDFGDGTGFTVYPVPGKIGIEIQALLAGVATGATMYGQGLDQHMENTERVAKLALGVPEHSESTKKRRKAPNKAEQAEQAAQQRARDFDDLRAARQTIVAQAAILWNCGGGGIEAVQDLLDEAGGYPKALARVMESSGLGEQFKTLQTWLSGDDREQSSEAAGTAPTTTPTGTSNTSA